MIESHGEAVLPGRGLPVVLDHRAQALLPHGSPEHHLRLEARWRVGSEQVHVFPLRFRVLPGSRSSCRV